MRTLIFGDSITWGAWDDEGGWVDRLKRYSNQSYSVKGLDWDSPVYNLGVSGDRTGDIIKRFDSEVEARFDEEAAIVFAIGTNDSAFVNAENGFWTPYDVFKSNLTALAGKAKKFTSKVVFVGLLPCADDKLNPAPFATDLSYKKEYIRKYNLAIRDFCISQDIDFIDLFDYFESMDNSKVFVDGLHPNAEGYRLMF